ncbi:MAG: metallophosphoesterase [Clostridia bacterium]|nr:metallophosphoesterase [Clostridia bacterium]MBR2734929.1 metallophosphoesterase [Clostridia bacterium]
MSIFCIADLHLSLSVSKPMDIFKGWENYVEKLEKNWKNTVSNDDTVVIAGDISWAINLKDAYEDFRFLNGLPGKKIVLRGNHDYWWSTATKVRSFFAESKFDTLSVLFNSAVECEGKWLCGARGWINNSNEDQNIKILNREIHRFEMSVNETRPDGKEIVAFMHYPPIYNGIECEEIINIMIERNIKKCYYGHIHGIDAAKRAVIGDYKGIDFHLVSCDYAGFCPVPVV